MRLGTAVYPFDPEDSWEPDFPRCALCKEEIHAGDRVVEAGRFREAHEECAETRRGRKQT